MRNLGKRGDAITVGEIMAYYLENHVPHTARPENGLMFHKILTPFWASLKLKEVNKATYQEYCSKRTKAFKKKNKRDISNDTLRTELEHMIAAFNYAHENEVIDKVPVYWKPEKAPARNRWLTKKEAAKLLRAARQMRYAKTYLPLFILMGLYTAARSEAILTRKWSDIDFKNGYIDYGMGAGNKRRSKPPIPKRLMRELLKAKQKDGHVINNYGQPVENILKSFKQACKDAGIEEATPHDLRRTAVSWMVQKGVDYGRIAKWAGMTVGMIERVYGHLAPEHLDDIKEAFG